MSFTGKGLATWYKDLFHIGNENTGVDSTVRTVKTGNGASSSLGLSKGKAKIKPDVDSTNVFEVQDKDEDVLFAVDTTNDLVKAGVGQHTVNSAIKEFCMSSIESNPDGTNWTALQAMGSDFTLDVEMGAGSSPSTSYTVATTASSIVQHFLVFTL